MIRSIDTQPAARPAAAVLFQLMLPPYLIPTLMNDSLTGKRVLILGLARQGLAMARLCARIGASMTVSDLRPAEQLAGEVGELAGLPVEFVLGDHPFTLLDTCDVIAASGSVPLDIPLLQEARRRGIQLTNDSLEFVRRCPAEMTIGITGSAGKTTTTTLVGEMARAAGRPVWVGGNIGRPLLDDLTAMTPGDLVVQELSSFQLDLWDTSPSIGAILNVTPNHLDRHKTMAAYSAAKANILRYQTADDIAVLGADDPGAEGLSELAPGRVRRFSRRLEVADGAFVRGGQLWLRDGVREIPFARLEDIQLRGEHNVSNILAAAVLADSAGIDREAIGQAAVRFQGVAHRLELVRTIDGVQYVNDSIATAPERALAAIAAYREPLVLLAGGKDKDMVWSTWARVVTRRAKVVILFGDLTERLQAELAAAGRKTGIFQAADLTEAVATAHRLANRGDVVLLSPGGTSFDAFRDFAERGALFRRLVENLAAGESGRNA